MEPFERGRLLLKLMLVLARDRRAMQGRIQTTGFVREYGELPPDLGVATLGRLGDGEIAALADSVGIRPAPAGAKSDIFMNGMGYRIEQLSAHPPVIVPDVEPAGLAAACRLAGIPADRLDERLEACRRLVEQRVQHTGQEQPDPQSEPASSDVPQAGQADEAVNGGPGGSAIGTMIGGPGGSAIGTMIGGPGRSAIGTVIGGADGSAVGAADAREFRIADPASPLKDDRAWLLPLLEYFWFTGSEQGKSHFPADYLLDFADPLNMNTWRTFDKRQAVESVWGRLAIRVAKMERDGAVRETVRIRVV